MGEYLRMGVARVRHVLPDVEPGLERHQRDEQPPEAAREQTGPKLVEHDGQTSA